MFSDYLHYLGKSPFIHLLAFTRSLISPKDRTRIKVNESKLVEYVGLPEDLHIVDYLNLSSMLAHDFSLQDEQCTHLSSAVFSIYRKLAEQNQRRDLLKKIRFAHGRWHGVGHEWLEFEENGKFEPFECTRKIPYIRPTLINKDLMDLINQIYQLTEDKTRVKYGHSMRSGKIYIPVKII